MQIIDIAILLFFISMFIEKLILKRKLIIRTSKNYTENIIFLLSITFFIGMTFFGAKTWIHYLIGSLGIIWFICMWTQEGITTEGFISMRRPQRIRKWNEISELRIVIKENIKITIMGVLGEEILYFKKTDYSKIIDIIKNNLPIKANLNIE